MKLLSLILAFYLILLAAVPCCSFDDCPDDKTEQNAGHKNNDGDCGNCSPFFSCEGCATATIASSPFQVDIISLDMPVIYPAYLQTSLPAVDYDFWQPPKLG